MNLTSTRLQGVWTISLTRFPDSRGSFAELFRDSWLDLNQSGGPSFTVRQINTSTSLRNVVRGIHLTRRPGGQIKYVTCVAGRIRDVFVDLRPESQTFAEWDCVDLCPETHQAILLDEGIGHAFMVLEGPAIVVYTASTEYDPTREICVSPTDETLGIPWGDWGKPILSPRDREAPCLSAILRDAPWLLGQTPEVNNP